ncbi:MAG: DUF3047 domain-containing protein [Victivallaceae bacterium]|nr:DUF3047 domain-containing protein [Victivallaceae bacterium]
MINNGRKMIRQSLFIIFGGLVLTTGAAGTAPKSWRENFAEKSQKSNLPAGWQVSATKWGVNKTSFKLENKDEHSVSGVLKIVADRATGAVFFKLSAMVDLTQTPIMRWRWRVNKFPAGGDGRKIARDDQAIVIYVGANDWMIKKSVAYRWETETPQGCEGCVNYAGGTVKVKWFCLRNRHSGAGKWVIEERNIAEDFKKAFGFIPKDFVLSVGANSQHTKSESLAYLDYIEFLPLEEPRPLEVASRSER